MTMLGLGTYAYAWAIGVAGYTPPQNPMDTFAFVRRADELGLRLVQIADNLPLHELSNAQLTNLLAETQKLEIAVEVGIRGIQPDNVRRYLKIASEFQSPILRAVVDAADFEPEPDEIVEIVRALLPEFEAANIILAIENHDRFKVQTLKGILDAIDSPYVGICLDTVNSFGSLEGPEIVVDTLGPYVVNLHVKDFHIGRIDHNMGFLLEGTPAGKGMLDMPWLMDKLNGFGREYNAILELWPPPVTDDMEATIRKENAWVEESVPLLRQWIQD